MGSIQIHNAERDALQIPDRQAYEHYHEPLGDFGVFNGQFEQGLAGRYANDETQGVEGWFLQPVGAGAVVDRVNGGLAGNWRIRGGNAGTALGGAIESWKYFPVDEDRDYYISAAFITDNAAATVYLGCDCFNAAKGNLGQAYVVNNFASGTSWRRFQRNIGPNGDVAWPAGTRYARIRVFLQGNAAIAAFAYVDDVQFGQLKKTYSPLIRLVNAHSVPGGNQDFTLQAWTVYAGSAMTLTLEEPGHVWYSFTSYGEDLQAADTPWSWGVAVFVNGVQQTAAQFFAVQGANDLIGFNTGLQRADLAQAVGARVVDLRIFVRTAGHTVRIHSPVGSCFYVRVT